MTYTLRHKFGENTFETFKDAVMAMYIMADHIPECRTPLEQSSMEIRWISYQIQSKGYFEQGCFTLFASK